MSRILSRISMLTGQISSHALHDVHAHSSSDVMRSNTELAVMVMSLRRADRRRHHGVAGGGHHLADLQHDLAGSSGLPVVLRRAHRRAATADRARVGVEELLPGEVLDRSTRRTCRAPSPSGSAWASSRPWAGPCRARYMFIGDVIMCRSFVVGRMIRNATNAAKCDGPHPAVRVLEVARRRTVEQRRQRVPDERPLLEVGTADRRRCAAPR